MDQFVPIADVVKAVGLKGEVKLYPLIDFHAPLLGSGYLLWKDGTAAFLDKARPAGQCVAVKPSDCNDRNAAEAMVGRQLGFQRDSYLADDFPRPAEGLPFRYLGRSVVQADGVELGTVQEVRRYASQILLVIEYEDREVMIPAIPPFLDLDHGLEGPLVVTLPEGLLDA